MHARVALPRAASRPNARPATSRGYSRAEARRTPHLGWRAGLVRNGGSAPRVPPGGCPRRDWKGQGLRSLRRPRSPRRGDRQRCAARRIASALTLRSGSSHAKRFTVSSRKMPPCSAQRSSSPMSASRTEQWIAFDGDVPASRSSVAVSSHRSGSTSLGVAACPGRCQCPPMNFAIFSSRARQASAELSHVLLNFVGQASAINYPRRVR